MTPLRSDHKVLIIAREPMLAALIGALVESTDLRAAFARQNEAPEAALDRVRPAAAILLDSDTDASRSDLFFARAKRRGTAVMIFGKTSSLAAHAEWARACGVPLFGLPEQIEALRDALTRLTIPSRAPRRGQRRVSSQAASAHFQDAAGVAWRVYDRRSGDRRDGMVERRFVSETGEVKRCLVRAFDAELLTTPRLRAQLRRAELGAT